MAQEATDRIFKFGEADAAALKEDEGMNEKAHTFQPKRYINPYLAGIGVGIALLAAFVLMGRGLGASGGVSVVVTTAADAVDHQAISSNDFFSHYLGIDGSGSLMNWAVFLILGTLTGGFISGLMGGRVKMKIEKGPRISNVSRLILALSGGALMGFGAKMARGCTSGQALTGGALLNLGSWVVMLCVFAGAYMLAYFLRRQWQ